MFLQLKNASSSSMGRKDRKPLPNTPGTGLIARINDNRLGAVYSSLNAFWTSREAALNGQGARRDAYSVIMFSDTASMCINNDFASSPSQLLTVVASQRTGHGTNFDAALVAAEALMESNWSTERFVFSDRFTSRCHSFNPAQNPNNHIPIRRRMQGQRGGSSQHLSFCSGPRVNILSSFTNVSRLKSAFYYQETTFLTNYCFWTLQWTAPQDG